MILRSRLARILFLPLAAAALVVAGLVMYAWTNVPFLLPEKGANWIRPDVPFYSGRRDANLEMTVFRTHFRSETALPSAVLTVRAMRAASVWFDGQLLLPFPDGYDSWKMPRHVDLGPYLSPGRHDLAVVVANWSGPTLLLAHCRELRLATDETWEANVRKKGWRYARVAGKIPLMPVERIFPTAREALLVVLPALLPVFFTAFGFTLVLGADRTRFCWLQRMIPSPSRLRWILLAAWTVLAANNIVKLPHGLGFDVDGHYKYIEYVATLKRLPLASEGWEMFHAPLYYVISALVMAFSRIFTGPWMAAKLVQIVSILCGAIQIEIAFRAMRHAFPERDDLQSMGTIVASLIPMNIYMSQYVSNEPMAAVFTGAAMVLCFCLVAPRNGDIPHKTLPLLGIVLGLALLTKVSTLVLAPTIVIAIAWGLRIHGWPIRRIAAGIALVLVMAFLISGWFYIRNAVVFGKPFVANWDIESGAGWWQDPGFRTPSYFLAFGESLVQPILSGISSFWDAIYSTFFLDGYLGEMPTSHRPPWNYDLMISGAWFGLLPALAMIFGAISVFGRPGKAVSAPLILSVTAVAFYFGTLILFTLKIPYYSTAKAFYTLGLLPCYGILAATGLEPFLRRPFSRAVIWGLVSCWATVSFGAYFVIR